MQARCSLALVASIKVIRLTVASFVLSATAAVADPVSDGANDAGTVASCTFGAACGSSTGSYDDTCAFATAAGQSLALTNFALGVPANAASIDGFLVEPRTSHTGCTGTIQLLKDGTPAGDSRTLVGTLGGGMCLESQFFGHGGTTDTWGTTWTPADVNDPDFGVVIDSGACSGLTVDTVRLTVFFTINDHVCGDGYRTGPLEGCDDGNLTDGDGCSSTCGSEGAMTADQQRCVNLLNSGYNKMFKISSQILNKCRKAYAKDGSDFQVCASSDAAFLKIQKAVAKATAIVATRCASNPPPYAYTDGTQATLVAYVRSLSVYAALLGDISNLTTGNQAASSCQGAVIDAVQAVMLNLTGNFNKCKKAALLGKKFTQAEDAVDLTACLPARPADLEAGLLSVLTKKCAGQTVGDLLPGSCEPSANDQVRADCLADFGFCDVCLNLSQVDALPLDCDTLDNGAPDSSCVSAP